MQELTAAEIFFRDAGAVELLSKDEEEVAVAHYLALRGSLPATHPAVLSAENYLIRANLRLVSAMARKYSQDEDMVSDLEQVGNAEMVRILRLYNPMFTKAGKRAKLSTYFTPHIMGAILAYLHSSGTIRVPKQNGLKNPDPCLPRVIASLDATNFNGNTNDSIDTIGDRTPDLSPDALAQLLEGEAGTLAMRALEALPASERRALSLYLGLEGEPMTQKEVGERLGHCTQVIRDTINHTLTKLRNALS